jgi:hypothetical protein
VTRTPTQRLNLAKHSSTPSHKDLKHFGAKATRTQEDDGPLGSDRHTSFTKVRKKNPDSSLLEEGWAGREEVGEMEIMHGKMLDHAARE